MNALLLTAGALGVVLGLPAVKKVEAHALGAPEVAVPVRDVASLPLSELLKSVTVPQLWAALGAVGALLVTVALVAYKLGAA